MRINLLPQEYRPQPVINPKRLFLMIIGAILVTGTLIGVGFLYLQLQSDEVLLTEYQQKLESYQSFKQELDRIEQRMQKIRSYQNEVAEISKQYPPFNGYLSSISASLDEEIWLTNITFNEKKITVKGSSLSFSMIGQILKHLKSPLFHTVRLISVNEMKTSEKSMTYFEFVIEIETKGGGVQYGQNKNT